MTPQLSKGSLFYPGPITVEVIQEEALSQFNHKLVTIHDFNTFDDFRNWWLEALIDDDVDTFYPLFVEAFDTLKREILSFRTIIQSYKNTLKKNPGMAIDLGGGAYAVIDLKGQLYAFNADMAGDFSSGTTTAFDASAYNDCIGAWEGMTRQATVGSVESPVLVRLTED